MIPLDLEVLDPLGRGSAGEVWSAQDASGRLFAVKFFSGATSELVQREVLAHANALIRVRHPGVVRVHAISNVEHPSRGTELALIMEYVKGTPLNQQRGLSRPRTRWPRFIRSPEDCVQCTRKDSCTATCIQPT